MYGQRFLKYPSLGVGHVSGGLFAEQFLLGCTHPVQNLPTMSASGCQADTGVLRVCARICVCVESGRTSSTGVFRCMFEVSECHKVSTCWT